MSIFGVCHTNCLRANKFVPGRILRAMLDTHRIMTIAISIALLKSHSVSNMLLLGILQRKKRDILIVSVHPGTVVELSAVSEFTCQNSNTLFAHGSLKASRLTCLCTNES